MSFSGYNFDIVTGASALVVSALASRGKAPPWLVAAWNAYGILCLCVIAVVAMLSSPMLRAFGDDPAHVNRWVTEFPFVWLPAVLVVAAIAGHVIVARRLLAETRERREPRA
jgi:small-conductance mechanosensitive channel